MGTRNFGRTASAAALLGLLAASGYAGARQNERTQAVSVPIVFETMETGAFVSAQIQTADSRLMEQREHSLALLEEVISQPGAPGAAVQNALEQKTRIAAAMETETRLEAALGLLGAEGAKAVSGERTMTVFAPEAAALDEKTRMQIIDAAAAVTGLPADSIKIILAKNE